TPSLTQPVGNLSGGNQQKVSLGKWLAADVRLLIVDEPTVGIDIKSKAYLHDLIWNLAAQGRSILLISSDMPEMIRLADRILFMSMETEDAFDPGRDLARLLDAPRYREWDELMRSLQERAPEAAEDEWWASMEEVFDLRWPGAARVST